MEKKKEKKRNKYYVGDEPLFEQPATDPQGMYTGVPIDPYEIPVQDVDDL